MGDPPWGIPHENPPWESPMEDPHGGGIPPGGSPHGRSPIGYPHGGSPIGDSPWGISPCKPLGLAKVLDVGLLPATSPGFGTFASCLRSTSRKWSAGSIWLTPQMVGAVTLKTSAFAAGSGPRSVNTKSLRIGLPGGQNVCTLRESHLHPLIRPYLPYGAKID